MRVAALADREVCCSDCSLQCLFVGLVVSFPWAHGGDRKRRLPSGSLRDNDEEYGWTPTKVRAG